MSLDSTAVSYFPQHESYLSQRCVRLDVAARAGVKSLVPSEVSKALNWTRPAPSAGLLVPHCDPLGNVTSLRVRLDAVTGGAKFQMPSGAEVTPWLPSQRVLEACDLPRDVLRDATRELVVVEGPVKAMALNGVGILAIGLGGVSAGGHDALLRAKRNELRAHPLLREFVALRVRRIVVLFDAGIATNASVADGAALNAMALEAEGAEVWIARLPLTSKGADQGPDDFLARHGVEELRGIIAAAVPASPPARIRAAVAQLEQLRGTKDERQARATEALMPALNDIVTAAVLRRGSPAMREATALEVQRATGMGKRVVSQAVERFEQLLRGKGHDAANGVLRGAASNSDARPEITISSDLHECTAMAVDALRSAPLLFCRGSKLCEVHFEDRNVIGRAEPQRVALVRDLNATQVLHLLSVHARWTVRVEAGVRVVAPPERIARQVEARGVWPGIRQLHGVVSLPLLLADGRVLDRGGYDPGSGLYLHLEGDAPAIPTAPSRSEAQLATQRVLSVVRDFPFEAEADKAAWLASVLTPAARYAFEGNAPLFATTGNTPGCGKGMLNEVAAVIVTGRPMAIMSPVEQRGASTGSDCIDDGEMRKRITAHVRSGTPLVLIDNAQIVGGNALNALLTCRGRWEDRILGSSDILSMPMVCVWFVTGNNLQIPRETRRRTVLIRLRSPLADPFHRSDFSQRDLIGWVQAQRQSLLRDVLVILRAYIAAGRPDVGLAPLGSFEEWSALVRNLIVWVGLPDPLDTLKGEAEIDPETEALRSLLVGLELVARMGPATSQRVLDAVAHPPDPISGARPNGPIAAAIGELVSTSRPSAAQLSRALAPFVGRVLDGRKLARKRTHDGWVWSVIRQVGTGGGASDGSDDKSEFNP